MVADYIYEVKELMHSLRVTNWCYRPYPNHPKGCPNYQQKDHCPDRAPYITDVLDITKPMFIVHSEFDLQAHVRKMKQAHPDWSPLQLRCVLYWQETSRKQLRERVQLAIWEHGCTFQTFCPEGMGVNVYATCKRAGLQLEPIKNLKTCRHVALIGFA